MIKLITGGLRIGISARLTKQALALYGDIEVNEIEELWHGLTLPYTDLFAWLEKRADKPVSTMQAPFRPVMLAHPINAAKDFNTLDHADFIAEWKWDGIRVQAVRDDCAKRLYSRNGDDISGAFPDILETLNSNVAIDGELLVYHPRTPPDHTRPFDVAPFSELQKRLNRKTVSKKLLASHPAFIRAYDILWMNGKDLRSKPLTTRRAILERWFTTAVPARMDLSPQTPFNDWEHLAKLRANPPKDAIEGLMLKKKSAPYLPGRPKGQWWKWKRDPFIIDTVLMYARRGHGKHSSFYSDYTFGVWRHIDGDRELVPVGKAYSGFTDEELKTIDKFVRDNTTDRFGPVRQVIATNENGLVFEVAFDDLNKSSRHKSGVAMRFPRINRIRWDKSAAQADMLETLEAML